MIDFDESDILAEEMEEGKPVFEDDIRIVYNIISEIPTHSKNWVKRVQLVKWKGKKSDICDIDIRRYSLRDNKYGKGITLSEREFNELKKTLNKIEFTNNKILVK